MSQFVDGIHNVFNNGRLRKILVSIRLPLVVAGFVFVMSFAEIKWFWYAFVVSLFGELIQVWCFASLDKKGTLAYNGLYKYVRNPMYLGRFFIVIGYFILLGLDKTWIWMVILPLTVVYYLYMWHRVQREEKTLKGVFGQPYLDYCEAVNRFIPSFRGMAGGKLYFWRWKLLTQNHGPLNFVGMLLSYAASYTLIKWVFPWLANL